MQSSLKVAMGVRLLELSSGCSTNLSGRGLTQTRPLFGLSLRVVDPGKWVGSLMGPKQNQRVVKFTELHF
eukprot:3204479-Amphidinium_carterae.2